MTRSAVTAAGLLCGLLLVGALAGCETTQAIAREEALRRWNAARARIKVKLAADQLQAGNVSGAAAELAEADRLDPNNPAVVPLRARVWLAEGKTTSALELLQQARVSERDAPASATQAEIEYLAGTAWQQQQRWDDALDAFQRAVTLDSQEVAYVVAVGETWLQLDRPQQALNFLTAHAHQFDWVDAYQATLAECHEQLGNWPAAAAAWQRVASAQGAAPEIRERAAEALYRAGRYGEAIAILLELVNETHTPPSWLRLTLAECYLATGRSTAACEQAQAVLQRDENSVPALRLMARSYALAGDLATALRMAQRALTVDGHDARALELVTALARRTGQNDLAATTATRLLALEAENPVAQYILAEGH
jgi:tetratricopeptide (TPR) repeat protein